MLYNSKKIAIKHQIALCDYYTMDPDNRIPNLLGKNIQFNKNIFNYPFAFNHIMLVTYSLSIITLDAHTA